MEARFRWLWQKIRKPLRVVGIITACVLLIALIVAVIGGYLLNWQWTGVSGGANKVTTTMTTPGTAATPETTVAIEQPPAKTIWDWLGLLGVLAIPVVVGLGAAWYTSQQGKVADAENKDNQREASLQVYVDKMSELLLEKKLRESAEGDEVRTIARVRTLTVLPGLDNERKRSVLLFLYESNLIGKDQPIIDLSGADFSGIDLSGVHLKGVNLDKTNFRKANLREAWFYASRFDTADLSEADFSRGRLVGTHLFNAILISVNFSNTRFLNSNLGQTNLKGANFTKADLHGIYLGLADLNQADLSVANLKDATGITPEKLEKEAKSLKGATMPDGSIHT